MNRLSVRMTTKVSCCALPARVSRDQSPETDAASRRISWLLAFITVLSLWDLYCTLLAYRAGSLVELNPVATFFMNYFGAETGLVLLKALTLGTGAGMLWLLRRSPLAIPACWILLACLLMLTLHWFRVLAVYSA